VSEPAFVHDLVLSGSLEATLAAAVPAVRDGLVADDPVVLSMPPERADAVLDLLDRPPGVIVLPPPDSVRRPGSELRTFRALADRLVDRAVRPSARLHVVNELPVSPSNWREWCRYEAAINVGLADAPIAGVCVYDEEQLPEVAVDFLRRAHPVLRSGAERSRNETFEPLEVGWATFDAPPDPLERHAPAVELVDPSLAAGRAAVRGFAGPAGLRPEDLEALVFAANEALTNALEHGRAPVRLSVWAAPGEALARIDDAGPGPRQCFPDIVQTGRRPGGIWLSGQLVDVRHERTGTGYSVRVSIRRVLGDSVPEIPRSREEER
jgi:hypothetical protein